MSSAAFVIAAGRVKFTNLFCKKDIPIAVTCPIKIQGRHSVDNNAYKEADGKNSK